MDLTQAQKEIIDLVEGQVALIESMFDFIEEKIEFHSGVASLEISKGNIFSDECKKAQACRDAIFDIYTELSCMVIEKNLSYGE
jgi:hypothetical protein